MIFIVIGLIEMKIRHRNLSRDQVLMMLSYLHEEISRYWSSIVSSLVVVIGLIEVEIKPLIFST